MFVYVVVVVSQEPEIKAQRDNFMCVCQATAAEIEKKQFLHRMGLKCPELRAIGKFFVKNGGFFFTSHKKRLQSFLLRPLIALYFRHIFMSQCHEVNRDIRHKVTFLCKRHFLSSYKEPRGKKNLVMFRKNVSSFFPTLRGMNCKARKKREIKPPS